ncbi:cyclin-j-like protein [Stylonychia lemnae]|uniref:Cyclin-j-like protein n=1 Tax=Stylonychia lemnae TaxID=5949 RepID=A0A078AZF4_STYLE|nr:cyclin-j-like protein [Stylonychia lemnae]|eukprot:CDW87491.1 cyclin-j-like protein [Stylonychia lemnae]
MAFSFSASKQSMPHDILQIESLQLSQQDLQDPDQIPPHMNGLSVCCYAPLFYNHYHFTCSECSTLFNQRGVMTLKEEEEYCETDISPFEQYREMLSREQYQIQSERVKGFYKYQPHSSFVSDGHRTRLVQKLLAFGRRLHQSDTTVQLAIKLMDRVFSVCPDIAAQSYDLIANGCLMLAAKFEELDQNIPMLFDLQIANKFKITYHQLKGVEAELLVLLDFDFMALTPIHFLKHLHATGLLISSDQKLTGIEITEKTLFKVKEYAFQFCEAACEHYELIMKFQPSMVAAVCLYMARKCCQLESTWNSSMEDYVGYKLSEMQSCIKQFEKELGVLVQYVIDNFREGDAMKFNKFKSVSRKVKEQNINLKVFEQHMRLRGIINPYHDCAINKIAEKHAQQIQKPSKLVDSLTLHELEPEVENNYENFAHTPRSLFSEQINGSTATSQASSQSLINLDVAKGKDSQTSQQRTGGKSGKHKKQRSIYEKENNCQRTGGIDKEDSQILITVAQNIKEDQQLKTNLVNHKKNQRNTLIR